MDENEVFRIVTELIDKKHDRCKSELVSKLEFEQKINQNQEKVINELNNRITPLKQHQENFTKYMVITNIISIAAGSLFGFIIKNMVKVSF